MNLYHNQNFDDFLHWIFSHADDALDMSSVEFRLTHGKGLGCFAKRAFLVGDTVFKIPQKCILGIDQALSNTILKSLKDYMLGLDSEFQLTPEIQIWLLMCIHERDSNSHFGSYLRTLSHSSLPTIAEWQEIFLSGLVGTNLSLKCDEVKVMDQYLAKNLREIQQQLSMKNCDNQFIQFMSILSIDSLRWARAHYLSRRYPGQFSYTTKANPYQDHKDPEMEELGCMCPLLDILNHDNSQDWLRFEITEDFLFVKCNAPIEVNHEIYSNVNNAQYMQL